MDSTGSTTRYLHQGHEMFRRRTVSNSRRDLRAMTTDGIFFSVMVGLGETYLPAFVLAVGLSPLAAGLITSLPLVAGAILQLLSPTMVRWFQSHRRWVVLCATIQAASFLPLGYAAFTGQISTAAVFLIAASYWAFGMSTGPAWNTWAETIVPKRVRARYFARRTRFTQAGVLFGFVAGGTALHVSKSYGVQLEAFGVLFLIAALCRFVSARCLAGQSEPQPLAIGHRTVTVGELLARIHHGGIERLLVYLVSVQFTVYLAAPFFNPFMLRHLKLSYAIYMLLIAVSFVAKMIALPALGNLAHRWGAQRLLWFGGIGIIPMSGLWLVSTSIPWLILVQFAGGVAWAAYELGMFLIFFETIPRHERTSILTLYNVANAMAMAIGSLFSGALLSAMGDSPGSYLMLFGLSSVARLGTVVFLVRLPEFRFRPVPIAVRTLSVMPQQGSLDRPIVSSLPEKLPQELVVAAPNWQTAPAAPDLPSNLSGGRGTVQAAGG